MMNRSIWSGARMAAAIAVVVVPFGYAITGDHADVLLGVGGGIGVGVGVVLRGGSRGGAWIGIVVGSIVGVTAALIRGLLPWQGTYPLVLPVFGLALGLVAGLRGSTLSGYRSMGRESAILALLVAFGLLPGLWAGYSLPQATFVAVTVVFVIPWIALVGGLLSGRREGWLDPRPPRLLVLGGLAVFGLLLLGSLTELTVDGLNLWEVDPTLDIVFAVAPVVGLILLMLTSPAPAFLLGRAAITWLLPRLRVYSHLTDYLRVMWIPIGGFAVGYLAIIVVFAGFYGMLERFGPGAFSGVGSGTGITDWLSFSFFAALGQDFLAVSPESVGARVLVGLHLILSGGWAIVLFAAVMTFIGPQLERIARRQNDPAEGR